MLLPKDYLRLWLTGEHVVGHVGRRRHALARRRRARLVRRPARRHRPHRAPTCRASSKARAVSGDAPRRARRPLGPAAARSSSRAAAATTPPRPCGVGVVRAGRGLRLARHLGRALRRQRRLLAEPDTARCTPSATPCPDTWHQMGVILSAADCLELVAGLVGRTRRRADRRARPAATPPARPCSCPISRASARRTTTPPSAAPSSGWSTRPTVPAGTRPCWKASPSPSATAAMRWPPPARDLEPPARRRRRLALGLLAAAHRDRARPARCSFAADGDFGGGLRRRPPRDLMAATGAGPPRSATAARDRRAASTPTRALVRRLRRRPRPLPRRPIRHQGHST